jgi:hypothetical protein
VKSKVKSILARQLAAGGAAGSRRGNVGLKAGATCYSLNFLLGVACFWFWSSMMSARVSEEPSSQ